MSRRMYIAGTVAALLIAGALAGFLWYVQEHPYPQDPQRTLEKVTGSIMRVGITENEPYTIITGTGGYAGIEPEIIRGFAGQLNTRIEWTEGSEQELVDMLKRGELEMVIGGFKKSTPWKKHAGKTNTYKNDRIMLVPKGENRFLVTLERFVHNNQQQIRELFSHYNIP